MDGKKEKKYSKKQFIIRLLIIEIAGLMLFILLSFLNEILDLPHLIAGAERTPINWQECLIETGYILILGSLLLGLTIRLLKQIRYLEGFLPVCSFCKRIRVEDKWIPIEQYISENTNAKFSHSYCPTCMEEHFGELMKAHNSSNNQSPNQPGGSPP